YTSRVIDIPATTGYGEPIQRFFKFKDGERIVAAYCLDSRVTPGITAPDDETAPPRHALAVTSDGYALRFSLAPYAEVSTRAGRKFARPADGVEVVDVLVVTGSETLIAATRQARAMLCPAEE